MQALATGLPAIATYHSAFPDQIIEGENGYLVPEGDYRALADKVLFYMQQPQDWARMGRYGRDLMKRRYDNGVLIERQIAEYQQLLG